MTNQLEIGTVHGRPFTMPRELLTHTVAILAKKGAGKTYVAGVFEEEFAKQGLPFVVLDPVGVHWGIRSSADGKHRAYPVVVFGGTHGDVDIERNMGTEVADAVIGENISAIIDLSELSKTAWRQFVRDFCRHLYQKNKTPRHVFIEEATEFVPQTRRPEMQEAYEAVERLVRMGRNRGLGSSLIAQRSAQIAKDVLTQMDVLICLRTVGPQDRKAVLDMFGSVLEEHQLADLDRFKQSITRLPDGTAWIWSPEFLDCFEQVEIRTRETYHAGATPGFEEVVVVQAKPDVAALRKRFAALTEEKEEKKTKGVKGEDTGPLYERISQLETEVQEITNTLARKLREFEGQAASLVELQELTNDANDVRRALTTFLSFDGGIPAGSVDEEAIVRRVMERIPSMNGPATPASPPEALRERYLQKTVDRLYERISKLDADQGVVIELLLGQDRFWPMTNISKAITGQVGGGSYTKIKQTVSSLVKSGFVTRGGGGGSQYKAAIRKLVEEELGPHNPTQQEVDSVEQHLLVKLVQS